MILRSKLETNIKYVVTTLYSAIKNGILDKIDNVSGGNVIKKVLHWRSSKKFAGYIAVYINNLPAVAGPIAEHHCPWSVLN